LGAEIQTSPETNTMAELKRLKDSEEDSSTSSGNET
jgi:hypothetical protein